MVWHLGQALSHKRYAIARERKTKDNICASCVVYCEEQWTAPCAEAQVHKNQMLPRSFRAMKAFQGHRMLQPKAVGQC